MDFHASILAIGASSESVPNPSISPAGAVLTSVFAFTGWFPFASNGVAARLSSIRRRASSTRARDSASFNNRVCSLTFASVSCNNRRCSLTFASVSCNNRLCSSALALSSSFNLAWASSNHRLCFSSSLALSSSLTLSSSSALALSSSSAFALASASRLR